MVQTLVNMSEKRLKYVLVTLQSERNTYHRSAIKFYLPLLWAY
jgi:hypothetical protein